MFRLVQLFAKLWRIQWKYLLFGSYVYVEKGSAFACAKGCKIVNSKIHLQNNSTLIIENGVIIKQTRFLLSKGVVRVGEQSFFSNGVMPTKQEIIVSNGNITFGKFNRIRAQKFWVRFGGVIKFGDYINLNEYSEIRCDESIQIGDFVEISYHVRIWDTNTHELEPLEKRRNRWIEQYLKRDVSEKPKTKPIIIGSDTWIGESVSILKGSILGTGCVCGYATCISGKQIPDNMTVINQVELRVFPNCYNTELS